MLVCPHSSCAPVLDDDDDEVSAVQTASVDVDVRVGGLQETLKKLFALHWRNLFGIRNSAAAALLLLTTSPATERPTDFGCHLLFHFPSRCLTRRCRERKRGPLKMRCPFPLLLSCSPALVVVIRQQLLFFWCVCAVWMSSTAVASATTAGRAVTTTQQQQQHLRAVKAKRRPANTSVCV